MNLIDKNIGPVKYNAEDMLYFYGSEGDYYSSRPDEKLHSDCIVCDVRFIKINLIVNC